MLAARKTVKQFGGFLLWNHLRVECVINLLNNLLENGYKVHHETIPSFKCVTSKMKFKLYVIGYLNLAKLTPA